MIDIKNIIKILRKIEPNCSIYKIAQKSNLPYCYVYDKIKFLQAIRYIRHDHYKRVSLSTKGLKLLRILDEKDNKLVEYFINHCSRYKQVLEKTKTQVNKK